MAARSSRPPSASPKSTLHGAYCVNATLLEEVGLISGVVDSASLDDLILRDEGMVYVISVLQHAACKGWAHSSVKVAY